MALKSRGFTLIEIMIAVSIIAVTFGVIVTTYSAAQRTTRDAKRQADLRNIQGALQQYYADQQYFPQTLNLTNATEISFGSGAAKKTYLKNIPIDPTSGLNYCYVSNCSSGAVTSCQSYSLFAQLENTPANTLTCGGFNAYNYTLTPP